jgi:hypothetical protein
MVEKLTLNSLATEIFFGLFWRWTEYTSRLLKSNYITV